jgi:phage repressor protein C with HTH and peptisase S24 domain
MVTFHKSKIMSTTVGNDEGFRTRLNRLLQQIGSVAELARTVGVSDNAIYKWLSGRGQPTVANLMALAKAGHVSVEWLATGHEVSSVNRASEEGSVQLGDYVFLPRHGLKVLAQGDPIESEQIVDYLAFRADWVKARLNTEPRNLLLIETIGDSMSPTLEDSDLLLVDLTEPRFKHDGIYVLRRECDLAVRRVQRRADGNLLVTSDNSAYESLIVARDELRVVGRVIWISGRL